jgi:hypothetical protein
VNIKEEEIQPSQAYKFFTSQEHQAIQREQDLLDLQVGGYATDDDALALQSSADNLTLP